MAKCYYGKTKMCSKVFAASDNDTWLKGQSFEDNSFIFPQQTPEYLHEDFEGGDLFNTQVPDVSSRPFYPAHTLSSQSPSTWNLTEVEKEFYAIYKDFSDEVIWQAIRTNSRRELRKICLAAWDQIPFLRCWPEAKPYKNHIMGLKALLQDEHNNILIWADFLQCKCSAHHVYLRGTVSPLYFAKYNNSAVFKLEVFPPKSLHNLRVIQIKKLNITI